LSILLSDYNYPLPEHLIAKYPPEHRGDSRLLVIHRNERRWEDRVFADILDYIAPGDCLVLNQTKVIPARLFGTRVKTGARIEILLHQRIAGEAERWKVLMSPSRKAPVGEQIALDGIACEVIEELGNGEKIVLFDRSGADFWETIGGIGEIPLPPYLHRAPEASDAERYQTVFAERPGAVAAPTAGLHFTPELLAALQQKGVKIAKITLHTGLGTFRPVESEDITQHKMHAEYFKIDEANAVTINETKRVGKRCIAVGTTSVRTLETIANPDGSVRVGSGMTDIFIYPPYTFKVPDAIITNFHLPQSTLLMMISAFMDERSIVGDAPSMGREFLLECYHHAIQAQYRFFSYGDAMLIL
jgi:S-adenosylmethionine:tRNA ribosyltransferase-isomerase